MHSQPLIVGYSLVKILIKKRKSILTRLVLCKDFLPRAKISLFRGAAPQCLGEAATAARASNRESQPKTEQNHAYNILCSKFIKCCEQYRGYHMQRSKRVSGPSRAIYTRGVKDHSAKAKDASVCISLNTGRVTTDHEQFKGARVATISRQEQYRDTHPGGP